MNQKRATQLAYTGIRLTLGLMFLIAGVGKFAGGIGNFVGNIQAMFAEFAIVAALAWPFALLIAVVEIIIGVGLVLGILTQFWLFATILLMLVLNTGLMLVGADGVAVNLNYVILAVLGLLSQSWLGSRTVVQHKETIKEVPVKTAKKATRKR